MQLLLFAVALVVYYSLHSLLAAKQVKSFLIPSIISDKFYRLSFNVFAILSLALILFFYKKIPSQFLFQIIFLKYMGGVVALIGLILLVIALLQYNLGEFSGFQQLKGKPSMQIKELKTSGFNSIVRHPLYFAMLCLMWGYFLFHPTDLFLVTAVISSLYLYFGTKLEEQKLIEEFGEAYKIYKQKVKMLIPYLF